MAVTACISGWPFAIATPRLPSLTMSVMPVIPITLPVFCAACANASRTRRRVGKRREFSGIETDHGRLASGESARIGRARLRHIDQNGVEHPRHVRANFHQCDVDCLLTLGIEGAEIDQQRVGARGEVSDFLRRDRHRRDRADSEQRVGGEGLGDGVGDAVNPRPPRAQARHHIRRNSGKRQTMGENHASQTPSAGMTRIRFNGLAVSPLSPTHAAGHPKRLRPIPSPPPRLMQDGKHRPPLQRRLRKR